MVENVEPTPRAPPAGTNSHKEVTRNQQRQDRLRERRDTSEPAEVRRTTNRSKDIIRIKLKPSEDYDDNDVDDEEESTGPARAATHAPPAPAPGWRRSFCSLFRSRDTEHSATPPAPSAGELHGLSALTQFRKPQRRAPASRTFLVSSIYPSIPPLAGSDKLKYYEKSAVIHIPLHTPPDERPSEAPQPPRSVSTPPHEPKQRAALPDGDGTCVGWLGETGHKRRDEMMWSDCSRDVRRNSRSGLGRMRSEGTREVGWDVFYEDPKVGWDLCGEMAQVTWDVKRGVKAREVGWDVPCGMQYDNNDVTARPTDLAAQQKAPDSRMSSFFSLFKSPATVDSFNTSASDALPSKKSLNESRSCSAMPAKIHSSSLSLLPTLHRDRAPTSPLPAQPIYPSIPPPPGGETLKYYEQSAIIHIPLRSRPGECSPPPPPPLSPHKPS